MNEFIQFNLIPSDKIPRGKQVLLKEYEHHQVANYEGRSDIADALMIWALTAMQNNDGNVPILLVNEDDFNEGVYGDFESPESE